MVLDYVKGDNSRRRFVFNGARLIEIPNNAQEFDVSDDTLFYDVDCEKCSLKLY